MKKTVVYRDFVTEIKPLFREFDKLEIKYCYRKTDGRLLVSYCSRKYIQEHIVLVSKLLEIEIKLRDQYEDNAPLFCYEEELFKLSKKANKLNYDNIQTENNPTKTP